MFLSELFLHVFNSILAEIYLLKMYFKDVGDSIWAHMCLMNTLHP